VATAVCGDYNHPIVVDFRLFRDYYLFKRSWGVKFINFYYQYGPFWASGISKNEYAKKIIRYIILNPLHLLLEIFFLRNKQNNKMEIND
jgi:hypothetical protein